MGARIVKTKKEIVENTVEEVIENGVTFIKNIHPGEILTLKDGSKFRFPSTRYSTGDQNEIDSLTELAAKGLNGIFIDEPEPTTEPATE
jgi:hypothetical protein